VHRCIFFLVLMKWRHPITLLARCFSSVAQRIKATSIIQTTEQRPAIRQCVEIRHPGRNGLAPEITWGVSRTAGYVLPRRLSDQVLSPIVRRARPGHGFDERVENVLGFSAWHDFINSRNEFETGLPTKLGRYEGS
jgi:hypothetical protein